MRVVLRGPSFLTTLLGSRGNNAAVAEPESSLVLTPGSAGDVHIGMPAADVQVRKRDITCETENGLVSAIRVHSSRYKTEAGIGVGDSVIALANHYPIRWTGDHAAEVEQLGMKFQIEQDRIVSILIS